MDWRAISRSRSRMSVDWRPLSRDPPSVASRQAAANINGGKLSEEPEEVLVPFPLDQFSHVYENSAKQEPRSPLPLFTGDRLRPGASGNKVQRPQVDIPGSRLGEASQSMDQSGHTIPSQPKGIPVPKNQPLSALEPSDFHPSSLPSFGFYGGPPEALPVELSSFPRRVRKTSFDHTVSKQGILPGEGRHQVNGRPLAPDPNSHLVSSLSARSFLQTDTLYRVKGGLQLSMLTVFFEETRPLTLHLCCGPSLPR
jgi:GATA-binding protein